MPNNHSSTLPAINVSLQLMMGDVMDEAMDIIETFLIDAECPDEETIFYLHETQLKFEFLARYLPTNFFAEYLDEFISDNFYSVYLQKIANITSEYKAEIEAKHTTIEDALDALDLIFLGVNGGEGDECGVCAGCMAKKNMDEVMDKIMKAPPAPTEEKGTDENA